MIVLSRFIPLIQTLAVLLLLNTASPAQEDPAQKPEPTSSRSVAPESATSPTPSPESTAPALSSATSPSPSATATATTPALTDVHF
jgi:cytoskeletal protein RodZ